MEREKIDRATDDSTLSIIIGLKEKSWNAMLSASDLKTTFDMPIAWNIIYLTSIAVLRNINEEMQRKEERHE